MKQFRDTEYFVTEDGKCFRKGKELKGSVNSKGYVKIHVCSGGPKRKLHALHRMVAECYLPNPKGLPQVNHIDGDKRNNHINNLEWCDQSRNMKHRSHVLGLVLDKTCYNLKIPAEEIKLLRWKRSINYPINYREVSEKWGIRRDYLSKIINGKERIYA